MAAGYQELFLEKGSDFTTSITLADANGDAYNLTNFTAKSQIRKSYYSANATATFVTSVNPTTGSITLSLDSMTSANIAAGRYVYDTILSVPGGVGQANTVTRILEGVVDVSPRVTRY